MNGVFLVKIKINENSIWEISSRICKHRREDGSFLIRMMRYVFLYFSGKD